MEIINDTDKIILHTIVDDNGDPINTTNFTGIVVKVFQKGKELDKFSLNTQSGYGDITKEAPNADGIIKFHLNAEKLRQGINSLGVYYEVKTLLSTIGFEGGTEESSSGPISLGILKKTVLTNETFS